MFVRRTNIGFDNCRWYNWPEAIPGYYEAGAMVNYTDAIFEHCLFHRDDGNTTASIRNTNGGDPNGYIRDINCHYINCNQVSLASGGSYTRDYNLIATPNLTNSTERNNFIASTLEPNIGGYVA